MKKGFIALLLLVSQSVFARTYIQCNSTDFDDLYMIINLSKSRNTMFVTQGMQNPLPNNVVRKLYFLEENETHHVYRSSDEGNQMFLVEIPNDAVEIRNNNFNVTATPYGEGEQGLNFSCFNNLFDE